MTTDSALPGPDGDLARTAEAIGASSLGAVPGQALTPFPLPDQWITLTVTTFEELLELYRDRRETWGEDHDTAVSAVLADIDTHPACENPS